MAIAALQTLAVGSRTSAVGPGCVKTSIEEDRWISRPIITEFQASGGGWRRVGDPRRPTSGALALAIENFQRFYTP